MVDMIWSVNLVEMSFPKVMSLYANSIYIMVGVRSNFVQNKLVFFQIGKTGHNLYFDLVVICLIIFFSYKKNSNVSIINQ